jgi:hypothetical protein
MRNLYKSRQPARAQQKWPLDHLAMFSGDDELAPARQSISGARTEDGGNDSCASPSASAGGSGRLATRAGGPSAPLGLASARRGANSRLLATVPSGLPSKAGDLELRQHFLLNDGAYTIQGSWSPGAVNFVPGQTNGIAAALNAFGPTNDLLYGTR